MAFEGEQDEDIFKKASDFIQSIAGNLDASTLLELYGRFKQVNEGTCSTTKPGFFDFKGKQKWEAWKKLGDMSKSDAMGEYIEIVSSLYPDWEDKIDSGEVKQRSTLGVAVSTMANSEPDLDDVDKTVFDWCIDGDVHKVCTMLEKTQASVDAVDDSGMTLLHWASDRGHSEMTKKLLDLGANVNIQDEEGQTPLHYAASCEHSDIIQILLSRGGNAALVDNDGATPACLTDNSHIKSLIEVHVM